MTTRRLCPRAIATLAVVAVLAAAAACASDGTEDLPERVSPPPTGPPEEPATPDLTPEEQEAVDEVQALFDEFMIVYVEILTAGEPATDSVLARFPRRTGDLARTVDEEIYYNFENEQRADGQLQWDFTAVVEVDLDRIGAQDVPLPLVRLRYCVDSSDWQTVDNATGEPAESGELRLIETPGGRHLVIAGAVYFDPDPLGEGENPIWRLGEWENEEDQPC